MAATHQRYLNDPLQQFILDGEAELANLEEPARTIRAQSLFAELQRRFQPETPVTIAEFTEKPTDTDVEHVVLQDQFDKLDEKENEDGGYAHGDEGIGEPRFRSHLKVKCMDNVPQFPALIHRGPDLKVIENLAAKDVDADLVSEGEIRNEERGYGEYKPTRPYHDRVASWMFSVQHPSESRRARPKQQLVCHFCGYDFEGRKGQKYCSDDCKKHRTPSVQEASHDPGVCGCATCNKVYDIFSETRHEYLLEKYDLQPGMVFEPHMKLTDEENENILEFAKHLVKESSNEQQ